MTKAKPNRHWILETYRPWDCTCTVRNRRYTVADVWEAAKEYEVQEAPIDAFTLNYGPCQVTDFISFAVHCARVMDADISYPIILAPDGEILDGRHRLARMLCDGVETVKFVKLKKMPTMIGLVDEEKGDD